MEGTKWRIGDGSKMDIWRDKWIEKPPTYRPSSGSGQWMYNMRVEELIDKDSRRWREEVIRSNFSDLDAEVILQIPLSRSFMEDKLIWILDSLGRFIVKSAYMVQEAVREGGH